MSNIIFENDNSNNPKDIILPNNNKFNSDIDRDIRSKILRSKLSEDKKDGTVLIAFIRPKYKSRKFNNIVKVGSIISTDDKRNLPVYPSIDDFEFDVIESDFNPDIDKTLHFTSADLNNVLLWRAMPLGSLYNTAHDTIKMVLAVMLLEEINMDPIIASIKLKASKYNKTLEELKPRYEPQEDKSIEYLNKMIDINNDIIDMNKKDINSDIGINKDKIEELNNVIKLRNDYIDKKDDTK